jgi:hypothetical protein
VGPGIPEVAMHRTLQSLLVPVLSLVPIPALAVVPGALDPTFGSAGKVVVPFDLDGPATDGAVAVLPRRNGTIDLAGPVGRGTPGDIDFGAARLTPAGSLDGSFGSGGKTWVAFDLGGRPSGRAGSGAGRRR